MQNSDASSPGSKSFVLSPLFTFPPVSWWAAIITGQQVYFDRAEHFEKMTCRNRYYIHGSNGVIILTVPLVHGRNQRTSMKEVMIDNKEKWQLQHWRTLVSVYRRTPFFEYYEPGLQQLFETPFTDLFSYNLAALHFIKHQLKLNFIENFMDSYQKNYLPDVIDLRGIKPMKEDAAHNYPIYYQPFADRNGFMADMSILDLLFAEGPATMHWLNDNAERLKDYIK